MRYVALYRRRAPDRKRTAASMVQTRVCSCGCSGKPSTCDLYANSAKPISASTADAAHPDIGDCSLSRRAESAVDINK